MSYTVCKKCGKELDPESIIFQRFVSYSATPLGFTQIPEWREVSWQREMAEQAKTGWLKSDVKKETALCSSCAEQFRKKIQRDEWLGGIIGVVFVVLAILGLLIFCSLIHG